MFRFLSIALSIFVVGASFTYHSLQFNHAEEHRIQLFKFLKRVSANYQAETGFNAHNLADFSAKNPIKKPTNDFAKQIITECDAIVAAFTKLAQGMNVERLSNDDFFVKNELSTMQIAEFIALHQRAQYAFQQFNQSSVFKSAAISILTEKDTLFEADIAAISPEIAKLSPLQQYILIETEIINIEKRCAKGVRGLHEIAFNQRDIVKTDKTFIQLVPRREVVHLGETFEADIAFYTYYSTADNISFKCNGEKLKAENGVAHFTLPLKKAGDLLISSEGTIQNKETGVATTLKDEFHYFVQP